MPKRPKTYKPATSTGKRYTPPALIRPTAAQRGYGSRWQKASKGYLDSHPLCAECERHGRTTAATVVDHVIPHKGDQSLFWDSDNWQPLCGTCHNRKTATTDGGFGR